MSNKFNDSVSRLEESFIDLASSFTEQRPHNSVKINSNESKLDLSSIIIPDYSPKKLEDIIEEELNDFEIFNVDMHDEDVYVKSEVSLQNNDEVTDEEFNEFAKDFTLLSNPEESDKKQDDVIITINNNENNKNLHEKLFREPSHTPYRVMKANVAKYINPKNYISFEAPAMLYNVVVQPYKAYQFGKSAVIVASLSYSAITAPYIFVGSALPFAGLYAYNAYKGEEGFECFYRQICDRNGSLRLVYHDTYFSLLPSCCWNKLPRFPR